MKKNKNLSKEQKKSIKYYVGTALYSVGIIIIILGANFYHPEIMYRIANASAGLACIIVGLYFSINNRK